MKRILQRYVFRNIGLKLVSLAAAVVLWTLIATEPEMETSINVPVEFHNVPKDLEILADQQSSVHLQVKGPSGKVRSLNPADVAVVLDLVRVHQPGFRTFTLDSSQIVLPRGITLVRSIPSQMRLVFEKRLSRDVRVLPRFSGSYAQGYEIDDYSVDPRTLKVVGPESRVALLDYVSTDPIDLSGTIGSGRYPTTAFLNDPYLRFENLKHVWVSVQMRKKMGPRQ